MGIHSIISSALAVVGLLAMPLLAGCNTVAGFGRDISATGRSLEGGAQGAQAGMFGSSAQAAQAATSPEQSVAPAAGGNAIYFASGSAELPADARDMIRATAGDFVSGSTRIEVTGYADTAGPTDLNERLSRRRAEAVAAALAAEGVPRERIAVDWHGETRLPVQTDDGVSEPQNRRVSIDISSG